ncbi:uncharacterized protein LOC118184686 [Stegodyphus dumicola]|uniref:uncharacterized protein LOC118184686 n=1 Tax=Stegodyphus dumicola TaxID=202533 RepID=UPI0015A8FAE5|nr:uncharacterized protein LOC118184686 [Stegodyphus dumicola]
MFLQDQRSIYVLSACFGIILFQHFCESSQQWISQNSYENITTPRRPRLSVFRFIAPFSMMDSCKTTSGFIGSCLSAQDCIKSGGRGMETCAWGLGVCCVHAASCGATTTANMSYFINPGYPSTWSSANDVCTFTVRQRLFTKTCQLRIDFEDFYIIGPSSGLCSTDRFEVSGQDLNSIIPVICGYNTGQHMYVQVGSSAGVFRFNVYTTRESDERKWRIRITQIPCKSDAMAPAHCLQYFTGTVGKFQSFNYGNVKSVNEDTYFLNMDYAICIRKEVGMCGATFSYDGDFNVNAFNATKPCIGDYLSFGTLRKCGIVKKGVIIDGIKFKSNGPMIITFVSDDRQEITENRDSGFSFKYTQSSCSAT